MLIFVELPLVPFLLNIKMCFLWGGFSDDYLLCRNRRGRLSRLSDNRCARMKEEAGRALSGAFIYRQSFVLDPSSQVCVPTFDTQGTCSLACPRAPRGTVQRYQTETKTALEKRRFERSTWAERVSVQRCSPSA